MNRLSGWKEFALSAHVDSQRELLKSTLCCFTHFLRTKTDGGCKELSRL